MKLHRPVAEHVVSALQKIFAEGFYADRVLERLFKNNRQLGSRDRKFIAESVYEMVRWWRLLWATLGFEEPSLESGELFRLLGVHLILTGRTLPPTWPEFADLDEVAIRKQAERARRDPATRESVPDWMMQLGLDEIGPSWSEWLSELNRPAPVVLRANRLKTDRETLRRRLLEESEVVTRDAIETDDGIILEERSNVFTSPAFKEGWFEVQDGASQQIAPLLTVEPGHRVIDACAGAGGKTLHLAALMRNKGKIISMDIVPKKLEELRKRCTRGGVDIVETRPIESLKSIKRLDQSADRLLLDVPCSGLGVLRRNPDAKWKLTLTEIERLRSLQAEILENYAEMVKPGGRMVYATCSCLPSENELQVEKFLVKHGSQWKLLAEKKFTPGQNGYDGFYAAALVRLLT